MSKFKIRLKITGFELEMEGDKKDAPSIPQHLSQQVAGFFQPAIEIAGGVEQNGKQYIDADAIERTPEKKITSKKARKRSPSLGGNGAGKAAEIAVDLKHDPNTWGNPKQSWNTANKSMWLLYVVDKQLALKEMSSSQISLTFNLHFRQNGTIQTSKVSRDLGRKKAETPSLASTLVTEGGEKWFLTEQGIREAEKLVLEGKGISSDD